MQTELLTIKETAEVLKIPKRSVYALVRRGELSAKKVGRLLRIRAFELEKYING